MDILNSVAKVLRELGLESPQINSKGVQVIRQDNLIEDNSNGLEVNIIGGSISDSDFNSEQVTTIPIQFTAVNTNQVKAYDDIWKIYNHFRTLPRKNNGGLITFNSLDGSFAFQSCKISVTPQQIGTTEHEAYIYVTTVEFKIKNGGQ